MKRFCRTCSTCLPGWLSLGFTATKRPSGYVNTFFKPKGVAGLTGEAARSLVKHKADKQHQVPNVCVISDISENYRNCICQTKEKYTVN